MKTKHDNRGFGIRLRKWALPTCSLAGVLTLAFACSVEERNFGNGNNNDLDASTDASMGAAGNGSGGEGGGTGGEGGASGASGASGGETSPDSGAPDSANPEAGASQECLGKTNGVPCGDMSGSICVNEACGQSSCGDGYIDVAMNEECEDGNTSAGDGCDPEDCKYSCDDNGDCDDQFPCNGVEACDLTTHHCVAGTPPDSTDQTPCVREVAAGVGDAGAPDAEASDAGDGGVPTAGICKSGFCVAAGCGNGLVQAGEECDDNNTVSTDGCKIDCTYTCEGDDECDDQDVCTGTETCNVATHMCVAGTPLVCDDASDCTSDVCDPQLGCKSTLIDADGDGHADEVLGACGDDCDDDDNTVYAGAGELCDGKDNDCDHSEDENAPIWYLDCDGDGYAEDGAFAKQTCDIPGAQVGCQGAGWTSRIPLDQSSIDCFDGNASVHPLPDPGAFSSTAVTGKTSLPFDWNCDGAEEKETISTGVATNAYCGPPIIIGLTSTAAACTGILCPILACTGSAGYSAASLPACGVAGTYSSCSNASGSCKRVVGTRPERCR